MPAPAAMRPRFQVVELETRLTPATDFFTVPPADTTDGPVHLRFEWGPSDAKYQNEFGIYNIDDAAGRVDGLLPSDNGYAGVALARAQVVLGKGSGFGAKAEVTTAGGQLLGFYLVANATTLEAQVAGATVFFSFDAANADKMEHVRTVDRGDGGRDFRFEDQLGGGDQDFNDAIVSVTRTNAVTAPGQPGQTVEATVSRLARSRGLTGEIGVYKVDGRDGSVGGFAPGTPGYLHAALAGGGRQTIFAAGSLDAERTITLDSGALYGFYFITAGTADQLLASNATNGAVAYFSFSDANPDKLGHIDWRSPDTFGVEDQLNGGDKDFDDGVFRLTFGQPFGTPTDTTDDTPPANDDTPTDEVPGDDDQTPITPLPPDIPNPLPPTPDTTNPVAAFRLTNDSGVSATDGLTNDAQGVLTVTDNSGTVAGLRAGFDTTDATTYLDILARRAPDGTVTIDTALLTQLNQGVALPDGPHTLFVEATDAAGNRSVSQFAFTLDRVSPAEPNFNLAATSDTGVVGDLRTDTASVTLSGTAEAGVRLQLSVPPVPGVPGTGAVLVTTTALPDGTFSFFNFPLAVGPNSYTVQPVDAAGNVGIPFSQTFVRNTPPTVTAPIADQTATGGDPDLTFDLTAVFADAERVLRFATAFPTGQTGNIDVQLFADQAPNTVANILQYVNSGNPQQDFNGSIFHRLAPGFVLQGGGFNFDPAGTDTATTFPEIPDLAPVVNEPGISNTRGTIAMAKLGGNSNSATSEFFFNLDDNSGNLDNQNGGFAVFGQVMNGGQQTVDLISGMPTFNGPGLPGAPPFPVGSGADLTNFPLNVTAADLAVITSAAELTAVQRMTFAVTSNADAAVASAAVVGNTLTVSPLTAGTTTITVQATDLDGSVVTTTFMVTVS